MEDALAQNNAGQIDRHLRRTKYVGYLKVALIYLAITLILFWPLTINIANTVVNGGGDVFQTMWNLWWVNYSLFVLHTSPYFTNLLYYPIGASLVTQTLTPLAGILSAPFQLVSMPFAYNVMFFLDFALSGLFMYLLADHITGNKYAAFIAGLIFALSPMHIAQAYGHLDWTGIEFLPLYLLFLIKMMKQKDLKYAIGAGISFLFISFLGDIEQGIITVVMTFFILLFYLSTKRRSIILNANFAKSLGTMILVILLLGSPFFLSIIYGITNQGALATASQQSSIQYNEIWSQSVFSYILPSQFNNQFHGIATSAYGSIFYPDPTERTAYLGIIASVLALIAIFYDRKREKFAKSAEWIFLGIVFFLLSLGPFVQFTTVTATTGIPSLYYLYSKIPLFNLVREPGRFDLVVTVALSILAAMGAKELFNHERIRGITKLKTEQYLTLALGFLIIIEYVGITTPGPFASSMFINAQIPRGYQELGSVQGNFTTMILPDLPNVTNPALYTGMSEYYQTAFKKQMVGGYTSRTNYTQSLTVEVIPISLSSLYLQEGYGFIYPTPIIENISDVNLLLLAYYNVHFVGVIRSAYNVSSLSTLYVYLTSLFGLPVYQDNTTIIFSTANALASKAGSNLVAYTTSPWIPGISLCQSPYSCNSTLSRMWWGSNARSIMVFAPTNETNVTMAFSALSYAGPTSLQVILNNPQNVVASEQLNQTQRNFSVKMSLQPGLNELLFYGHSALYNEANTSINYGLNNIIFNATK